MAAERIEYAFYDTPFGRAAAAWTGRGACAAAVGADDKALLRMLSGALPGAALVPAGKGSIHRSECETLFDPFLASPPLDLRGTGFQVAVWKALMAVPPGRTESYASIARAIGRPSSARAVAAACAANRIAVAVPCHRIVRSDGSLSGYRWGSDTKKALLAYERREASPARASTLSRKPAVSVLT